MFVENNYYIHPDFQLVFQGLYKEKIGSRHFALELTFIKNAHFLFFLFFPAGSRGLL